MTSWVLQVLLKILQWIPWASDMSREKWNFIFQKIIFRLTEATTDLDVLPLPAIRLVTKGLWPSVLIYKSHLIPPNSASSLVSSHPFSYSWYGLMALLIDLVVLSARPLSLSYLLLSYNTVLMLAITQNKRLDTSGPASTVKFESTLVMILKNLLRQRRVLQLTAGTRSAPAGEREERGVDSWHGSVPKAPPGGIELLESGVRYSGARDPIRRSSKDSGTLQWGQHRTSVRCSPQRPRALHSSSARAKCSAIDNEKITRVERNVTWTSREKMFARSGMQALVWNINHDHERGPVLARTSDWLRVSFSVPSRLQIEFRLTQITAFYF